MRKFTEEQETDQMPGQLSFNDLPQLEQVI